jgi:hypothetical protein
VFLFFSGFASSVWPKEQVRTIKCLHKKHGTGRRKREEEIEGRRDGGTKEENLARVMASSMKVASVIATELGSC